MIKFAAGRTYFGRFIGDSDSKIELTVASRTAKTIVTTKGERFRVKEYNGSEYVSPLGSYSMAPSISAEREKLAA